MKKLIVLSIVALLLTIFNACQKDDLVNKSSEDQLQELTKPDVYSENGYLVFRSIEVVDSVIRMLSHMSDEEKYAWEELYNIKSARSEFEKIFKEYEKIESYDEFLMFKREYVDKLKFNESDPEDCSIDYPFSTDYFVPVLNSEGIIKIGKSIVKYTKESHIVVGNGDYKVLSNLEQLANSTNVFIYPELKSNYTVDELIHDFPEDNPWPPYNYRWHEKPNKDRRLLNELRIERYRYDWYDYSQNQLIWRRGYIVYFKQRSQKKSWGSWNDYKTTYHCDQLKCKVGNEPISTFDPSSPLVSPEVRPSASIQLYFYYIDNIDIPGYTYPLLDIPLVSYSCMTSCRGFDGVLYPVDRPVHSGFTEGMGIPWVPDPAY